MSGFQARFEVQKATNRLFSLRVGAATIDHSCFAYQLGEKAFTGSL